MITTIIETSLPKTYQKPKPTHPWRQYNQVKITTLADTKAPLKEVITDIATHWETYEVTFTMEYEGSNLHTLSELPQEKAAAWLSGFLRKYYIGR